MGTTRLDLRFPARLPLPLRADVLLVFIVSLFCYSFQLGNSPLGGTEGNRAITADQMVHTHQWVVPHLFDQVYLKKPPLHYWILAGAEIVTRRADEWIWRLPSGIGASVLAAMLCIFGNRWFGRPSGIVAGFSHLAMLAVWEQNRAADIDALNSVAAVLAACGLIDLDYGPVKRRWLVIIATGIAVGATLLLKGPAGMTVVVGALIGPSLMNRNWRRLARPGPWMAMVLGGAIFGLWVFEAYLKQKSQHLPPDTSGLAEAIDKSNIFRHPMTLLMALGLPPTLFAFALPISLAIPIVLHRSIWKSPDDSFRRLVRALVGTLAVGAAIALLTGMTNPRYAYVLLPIMCPLAGAAVVAWRRKGTPQATRFAQGIFGASAIIFTCAAVGLAIAARRNIDHRILLIASPIAACLVLIPTLLSIRKNRWEGASVGLVALIILSCLPFAVFSNIDRNRRSAYTAARELRLIVPRGTLITAGMLPVDHPELFYYSGVKVESHMKQFAQPMNFPGGRLILLDDKEYAAWMKAVPGRLSLLKILWPQHEKAPSGYLLEYAAPGDLKAQQISPSRHTAGAGLNVGPVDNRMKTTKPSP